MTFQNCMTSHHSLWPSQIHDFLLLLWPSEIHDYHYLWPSTIHNFLLPLWPTKFLWLIRFYDFKFHDFLSMLLWPFMTPTMPIFPPDPVSNLKPPPQPINTPWLDWLWQLYCFVMKIDINQFIIVTAAPVCLSVCLLSNPIHLALSYCLNLANWLIKTWLD